MNKIRAAMLLLTLIAPLARADGDYFSPLDERVRLSLGAMYLTSSTNGRIDSTSGVPGTYINGEANFGLDKTEFEPKFQAVVRVTPRQRLTFDYFTLDRSGDAIVGNTPLRFRDVTFPAGSPLQTQLSMRSFGISYGFSFWRSETLEFAASVGVKIADLSSQAKTQTSALHIIQDDDHAGPIPLAGLDGTWVISTRFYVDARAQYVTAHVDNIDGALGFYDLDLLYRIRPNISFGLGYTAINAHLTSVRESNSGYFQFDTKGPEMFFRAAF